MNDGPYKLPAGWRWVKLGEVCIHIRSSVDPRKHPNELFCLFSIAAYDRGLQPEHAKGAEIGSAKVRIENAVCLFSKLNPRIPRAWVVDKAHCPNRALASTEFMPLKPRVDTLALHFLGHVLLTETFLNQVRRDVSGATGSRQRLKPAVVLNALIPLPPLDQQRRIVARIEELMARIREARRLRQQAREDAEHLWQSVLADTFPRPGSYLPSGWRWVRLGEVANAVNGCGFPKRYQGHSSGPIAFLKVSDLNHPLNEPYVRCAANYVDGGALAALRGRAYEPGTVVFPKIGGAIATNKKRKLVIRATFDNNIMGLVPNRDVVDADYLLMWLYRIDLTTLAKIGPVPSIRQSVVHKQQFPLPPLAEQRLIVAHLEAVQERIRAIKEAQAATEAELKRLEQSILDKAFRGEL